MRGADGLTQGAASPSGAARVAADRPGPGDPLVHIVILNWKGAEDTIRCLESVSRLDYSNYRVVVCDNDSRDGSLERIASWAEGRHETDGPDAPLTLIPTGANLGFTGGCNVGIAHALGRGAEFVFLLNNDAWIEPGALGHLVAVAREADAAIVGASVLAPEDEGERVLFRGASWPALMFGRSSGPGDVGDRKYWPSCYATGCALLLSRDLLARRLEDCGHVFDPSFFMYCEEVDLCLYGAARGDRCVIARDAIVHHCVAKSSGGWFNPRSYYYITRNRIYLANRWLRGPWKLLFHAYYLPSRLVLQALGPGRWRRKVLRAVGEGLVDGYRGVAGQWKSH